jgi:hypothetical protein
MSTPKEKLDLRPASSKMGRSSSAPENSAIIGAVSGRACRPLPPDGRDDLGDAREHYWRNLAEALLSPLLQLGYDGRIKFLRTQVAPCRGPSELHPFIDHAIDTIGGRHATSSASSAEPATAVGSTRLPPSGSSQLVTLRRRARLRDTSLSKVRPRSAR